LPLWQLHVDNVCENEENEEVLLVVNKKCHVKAIQKTTSTFLPPRELIDVSAWPRAPLVD
jgi:hypothetical protein